MSTDTSVASFLTRPEFTKELVKVLPDTSTPARMVRIALTEIRSNPKLAACTPASVATAIMKAATLGLEVGSCTGHVYLVPYGVEATFMLGYRGMIELAYRSGKVSHLYADVVREGDDFIAESGTHQELRHRVKAPYNAPVIRVYACARMKDGTTHFAILYKEEVDDISRKSRSQNIWKEHWTEMAKKTAVRRLFKTLPSCTLLDKALEAESSSTVIDMEPLVPEPAPSSTEALADRLGAP